MSNNIQHSKYLSGSLSIPYDKAKEYASWPRLAEGNFLRELDLEDDEDLLEIEDFWWYGEFSGRSYDTLKKILAATTGSAVILFVWEDGNHSALDVVNGKVSEKKVKFDVE